VALGVVDPVAYTENSIVLESGDLVVVYSDGVTDATSRSGEVFGRDRIVAILERGECRTAESAVRAIAGAAESFEEGTAQSDDVTVIACEFHGATKPASGP
jgi:sigma-B regulation protein RsbU (phosphoserine phosphatase)